jgi:hypothetical protein
MAKSIEVQHESDCWIILFKDAEHTEFTVHTDVFLKEETAKEIATALATSYATEFGKKMEPFVVGYEFICKVRPNAEWRVQRKKLLVPQT